MNVILRVIIKLKMLVILVQNTERTLDQTLYRNKCICLTLDCPVLLFIVTHHIVFFKLILFKNGVQLEMKLQPFSPIITNKSNALVQSSRQVTRNRVLYYRQDPLGPQSLDYYVQSPLDSTIYIILC